MQIESSGILCSAKINSNKACYTFSSFVSLSNGSIIATARGGNNKDSELEGIEFFRSDDEGEKWSEPWEPFKNVKIDNLKGSLKLCYLTEISDSHIIASFLWIDRTSIPGKELFNADTEGCLPMKILIADSYDNGNTWSKLRKVQLPKDIGPPSLTNPIMKLPNGKLIMSIENNKDYYDESKWYQKNIFICSSDNGKTWSKPYLAAGDETGRNIATNLRIITTTSTYSPSTTNAVTVQVQIIQPDSGVSYTWFLNRSHTRGGGVQDSNAASSLVLMEILA